MWPNKIIFQILELVENVIEKDFIYTNQKKNKIGKK